MQESLSFLAGCGIFGCSIALTFFVLRRLADLRIGSSRTPWALFGAGLLKLTLVFGGIALSIVYLQLNPFWFAGGAFLVLVAVVSYGAWTRLHHRPTNASGEIFR